MPSKYDRPFKFAVAASACVALAIACGGGGREASVIVVPPQPIEPSPVPTLTVDAAAARELLEQAAASSDSGAALDAGEVADAALLDGGTLSLVRSSSRRGARSR